VSGRAWDSDALVQTLATYMAAPGGIVAITPAHRALAARLWACMATMGRRLLHRDEPLVVRPVQQAAGTGQVSRAASGAEAARQLRQAYRSPSGWLSVQCRFPALFSCL